MGPEIYPDLGPDLGPEIYPDLGPDLGPEFGLESYPDFEWTNIDGLSNSGKI